MALLDMLQRTLGQIGSGIPSAFGRTWFQDWPVAQARRHMRKTSPISPETDAFYAEALQAARDEPANLSPRARAIEGQTRSIRAETEAMLKGGNLMTPLLFGPGWRRRKPGQPHYPTAEIYDIPRTSLGQGQALARDPALRAEFFRRLNAADREREGQQIEHISPGAVDAGFAERLQREQKAKWGTARTPGAAELTLRALTGARRATTRAQRLGRLHEFAAARKIGRQMRMGQPVPMGFDGGRGGGQMRGLAQMMLMSGSPDAQRTGVALLGLQQQRRAGRRAGRLDQAKLDLLGQQLIGQKQGRETTEAARVREHLERMRQFGLSETTGERRHAALMGQGTAQIAAADRALEVQLAEIGEAGKARGEAADFRKSQLQSERRQGALNAFLNEQQRLSEAGVAPVEARRQGLSAARMFDDTFRPPLGMGPPSPEMIGLGLPKENIRAAVTTLGARYPNLREDPSQAGMARQAMIRGGYDEKAMYDALLEADPSQRSLLWKLWHGIPMHGGRARMPSPLRPTPWTFLRNLKTKQAAEIQRRPAPILEALLRADQ